jgi:hypothetical protein
MRNFIETSIVTTILLCMVGLYTVGAYNAGVSLTTIELTKNCDLLGKFAVDNTVYQCARIAPLLK